MYTDYVSEVVRNDQLLNCVRHDDDERRKLWTFFVDGEWLVTDEKPLRAGYRLFGFRKVYCSEIKVKERFSDASSLLEAQRDNGFNSWKLGTCVNPCL